MLSLESLILSLINSKKKNLIKTIKLIEICKITFKLKHSNFNKDTLYNQPLCTMQIYKSFNKNKLIEYVL